MDVVRVEQGSFLTLHYCADVIQSSGELQPLLSTFGGAPATMVVGQGLLAPAFETALIGLAEGEKRDFHFGSGEVFGARSDSLVKTVTRQEFASRVMAGANPQLGATVEFLFDKDLRAVGLVTFMDEEQVVLDFNHPLAGMAIRFEASILSVL